MTHTNEFNFASSGQSGVVYFNYRTAGGTNGNITEYRFGNGKGGSLGTAIHSGNIGSQSVNYASSAGSASSASTATYLGNTGWGNGNFTYYQTSGSFAGNSGWCHYLIGNHGNGSNYYHGIIGMPFWDTPFLQEWKAECKGEYINLL